ncbi:MAG: cytochrome c1 [Planktomarina sp.]
MFKKLTTGLTLVLALAAGGAHAEGAAAEVHDYDFSFEGVFGSYDQEQLRRGLKIYTDVCSDCHGMKFVPIRTLGDEGGPHLSKDEVRGYATQFVTVWDQSMNNGEGDLREAKPADHFPASNDSAAPDLSLMAKARAGFHGPSGTGINQLLKGMGGPEYITSLLMGYHDAPSCAPEDFPGHYNTVFASGGYPDECKDDHGGHKYPGSWIAMAQPLYDEAIEFEDGHANDQEALSEDISAFLMWTAEPKLNARKRAGFVGVLILALLSVCLYMTNKMLWAPHKGKKD